MANIDDTKIPIGGIEFPIMGRMHDVSEDHVVTGANEVFDDAFGERQSQINDKLRHYTKMAHIRIDAEEITREHNDNLLNEQINAKQLEIGAVETDIEPILDSPNMLPSGAVAFNLGWYRGNENPEWVYCITDGAMRVLAGIKKDGSVEWMVGVPTPVKNYVDAHIQELIERLEELEEHILEELEKKVDKEEGKSLINKDYADGVTYIENPEFVEVKLDEDERIIEAIKKNGTKYFGTDVENDSAIIKTIDNPEFIKVCIAEDKILYGIQRNGNFYFGAGVPTQIVAYVSSLVNGIIDLYGYYDKNPEFVEVHTDKSRKITWGVKTDGDFYFGAGVPSQILKKYEPLNIFKEVKNPEYIVAAVDATDKFVFGINREGDTVVNSLKVLSKESKKRKKIIHVIGYGQSLMAGSFSGEAVSISNYDNLFKFKGGVRTYDAFGLDSRKRTHITRIGSPEYGELFINPSEKLSSYDYNVLEDSLSSIVKLSEQRAKYSENTDSSIDDAYVYDLNGEYYHIHQNGETVLTSFCNAYNKFIEDRKEVVDQEYMMLASCAAYGSAEFDTLLPLDRGGTIHNTNDGSNLNYFEVLMSQVVYGKKYADKNNLDYSVDYVLYFEEHTDQDVNSNPKIVACRMLQLFSIINSRVKGVTNQRNDIKFIVPCSNLTTDALTLAAGLVVNGKGYIELTEQEKEIVDSMPNNDIVPYSMDNVYGGVAHYGYAFGGDGVHHNSSAQSRIGKIIGTNIANETYKPLYPKQVRVSGNDIYITYNVPVSPIMINETAPNGTQTSSEAINRGDKYGFLIKNNGVINDIITNVSVVESDMIKISCSENPTNMTLEYALTLANQARRGNICDSYIADYIGTGNYCYSFSCNL